MPLPFADVSHASPEAAQLFYSYHSAKSAHDLEAWASFFDPSIVYVDATLGWYVPGIDAFRSTVAGFMPSWGTGRSYATRVLGDTTSAVLAVTDTPELFGHEIRSLSPVDFVDGKIVRFVDYWDSRHFSADAAAHMRTPDPEFPRTLGEDAVISRAHPSMVSVTGDLSAGLSQGNKNTADLFADDAVFEDLTLHTQIIGKLAIDRYLRRCEQRLPYAAGSAVVHILGNHQGGGYEWAAPGHAVRSGVVALELSPRAEITRLTAVWDGGRLSDADLADLRACSDEPIR